MIEKYLKQIEGEVEKLFKSDKSGHNTDHLKRTMKLAITIAKEEGGDELVVGLAGYLHDIHRIMQNDVGYFVSPAESLPVIRKILSVTDLDDNVIEQICYCVEYHEYYNWNGNNVTDLNALIVQDADNLDAIGAIGVVRAFVYGSAHNIKMYDENIPLNTEDNYEESEGDNESTIHHFYHKLLKLENNMNTQYAKKLAHKRTEFMKAFADEFIDEFIGVK